MSRTRRFVTAPWRGAKALTQMIFRPQTWRSWALPRSAFDYMAEVGDGTGSSAVMAPLLWIARNFPEAPPELRKETAGGELEVQPKHDMLRLLVRPNSFYSGTTLWMASLLDWYVDGNAYWIKVKNRAGAVAELWWAPSFLLCPKGNSSSFITHYEYKPGTEPIRLEPDDVVHFRYGLDPEDPRRGRSPLKSVLREVFTDDEAANFTASLLRNSGVPGVVVSPKDGAAMPGPDDVKATKAYLAEAHTGDRRGEPLVMSGPTSVEQFGFSPSQLDLKALRRIPEERITGVLGIPAIVAGLGAGLDRSTFANFAEAREAAYQENIIPAQRIIGEELRFQLLPDFERDPWRFRVGFDTSKVRVLQEDEEKRARRLDIGVRGGWVRVDEARREMGHQTTSEDEIYLRQFSMLEVPAGELGRTVETDAAKLLRSGTKSAGAREQGRLIMAIEKEGVQLSAAFAERLEADFDDLGQLTADAFESTVTPEALASRTNGQRKASDDSIAAQVIATLGLDKWIEDRLRASYETHYRNTAEATVATINQVLDLEVNLPDEAMRRVIHRGGTRLALLDVERDTRRAVIRAVASGREEGLGPIEVARRIRDEVPAGRFATAGPKYRAEVIARTETKFAQNVSSLETYKSAETITAVVAFDARLGDTDPDCEARDGQTFTFEQAEVELGLEHPNGTLSFGPVVAESLEAIA